MSNVNMIDILSIANTRDKGDFYIESCGDLNAELNGYFIVLRKNKINDLVDYVIDTFGDSYTQMLKDILASNDEEDIASSVKTFSPDVDKSYTELYLEEFGTSSRIKSFVEQENLMRGVTPTKNIEETVTLDDSEEIITEESLIKGTSDLTDEALMLSEDNIKPQEPDNPNPDLEREVRDLEGKLSDQLAINELLTKSTDELNSKNSKLTDTIEQLTAKYENVDVPNFATDSIIKVINDVSSSSTKDALVMLIQTLTSLEENYALSKVIEILVENYVTLEAIDIEKYEQ